MISPELYAKLEAKYTYERDKRLQHQPEGAKQFVKLNEESFKDLNEDRFINYDAVNANQPLRDGSKTKVLITGGGHGGLLMAVRLIQAGFDPKEIVIVDKAGGFGGTWYWNRYPGLMCDVESYIYLPLLEEMGYRPRRKYSSGEEIRVYAESICSKYDLHRRAMFQSRGERMAWNEGTQAWDVEILQSPKGLPSRHTKVSADFVYIATGVLDTAKLPDVKGFDQFEGEAFHTARWRYDITGGGSAEGENEPKMDQLLNKRVGIIGTGRCRRE